MYRFRFGQKLMVSASCLLWGVWAAFAIYYREMFKTTDISSKFWLFLVWSIIVFFAMLLPIVSPDMNLVSKEVNDGNRLKVVEIRRTLFCSIQLLFIFLACGTCVSMFFPETWRVGVGVTVGIYAACLTLSFIGYGIEFKRLTKTDVLRATLNELSRVDGKPIDFELELENENDDSFVASVIDSGNGTSDASK